MFGVKNLYPYELHITWVWKVLVLVAILCVLGIMKRRYSKNRWKGYQALAGAGLAIYLIILLIVTVFARKTETIYQYVVRPFGTFGKLSEDNWGMALIIGNIFRLMPLGILLPVVRPGIDKKQMVLIGFGWACSIEMLQLFLRRGLFECDDIIFNMIGVGIGYAIYWCGETILNKDQEKICLLEMKINKCWEALDKGLFVILRSGAENIAVAFLEMFVGSKRMEDWHNQLLEVRAAEKGVIDNYSEDKEILLSLWMQKWYGGTFVVEDYFCKLFQDTYQWVKYKANINRKKNFRAKFAFLSTVFLGFLGYCLFFIWNMYRGENKWQTLFENGFVLILLIMFSGKMD